MAESYHMSPQPLRLHREKPAVTALTAFSRGIIVGFALAAALAYGLLLWVSYQ